MRGSDTPFILPDCSQVSLSDTDSGSGTEEMIDTVPQFRNVLTVSQHVHVVYTMFMGVEGLYLPRKDIDEVPMLTGTTLDVVYCNLAKAVLSGRRYDWGRLRIPHSFVHSLAAALLECLSDKLIVAQDVCVRAVYGHPLACLQKNTADLRLLSFRSLVWHLASIVDDWHLFCDRVAVVDFEVVLCNAQVETQHLIRLLPHSFSYGMIRLGMAHIGRCTTACLDARCN